MHKIHLIHLAQQVIANYLELKQINKSQLAKVIGISPSIIGWIESGQADNVSEEMLQSIINILKPDDGWQKIGTSNYESIHAICKQNQSQALMSAVIGYPGAGKTTALMDYYRTTKNAYYVECINSMNRHDFLNAILANMGVTFVGSVHDIVKLIIKTLNKQDKPLLIIDEAGKVGTSVMLDLHDIRNATMGNASFVLAGCDYFKTDIEKWVARDKKGYPEFHSRVVNWHKLERPTKAEINAICRENGIAKPETIKEFQKLVNYRQLFNAITNEKA